MDSLRNLKVVVSIDDEGSLVAAAHKLGLSLPAVSRALSRFENTLGVILFERTARRCRTTDAGRSVVERSRRLLADYAEMLEAADGTWKQPWGKTRVTAPLTFRRLHLVPAICRFLDENPGIDIGLNLTDAVVDLQAEDYDLGVRIGPVETPTLIARRVGSVRWWTVASPAYLEKYGAPNAPSNLAQHHWIQHSDLAHERQWPGHLPQPRPAVRDVRLVVNDATSALDAARRNHGVASVLSYQAANDVAQGHLIRVMTNHEPPALPVSLVYPEIRRVNRPGFTGE